MRGEGEEEGSDTFKALKTESFTISVSSSFLSLFDSLSGGKKRNWQSFSYMVRVREGEGKEEGADCEIYTILDALEALYKRYRGIIKESLYKWLIGLNMSLYSR